jgi:hypothetical protein
VGHAWLNVFAMKGISLGVSAEGIGIGIGTLGLDVAEVGRGGKESIEGVRPGMRMTTTFRIERGFCSMN